MRRRYGSYMKMLIIVGRDSMLSELEELLRENGITAYTIISNVMGKGLTGRVSGTFLHPDINSIICSVLPSDQADRAIRALQALLTAKNLGHPAPLKVFTLPCEEHM
jgi:nitrogen regulatory protein PII